MDAPPATKARTDAAHPTRYVEGMSIDRAFPLIIRKVFFEQFTRGEKSVEYRRHRPPFVAKVPPGRPVRIVYRYQDLGAGGRSLLATCEAFDIASLSMLEHDLAGILRAIYPDLDDVAMIHLRIIDRV